ncbi:hypothetical protein Tco_1016259 [Tanacetum coccineum]|uniref:Uncharacterized protein n=1 Tax=Tanacetum coccineum TaxID=301880 RepID=A0ABQ5FNP0_9ASTR
MVRWETATYGKIWYDEDDHDLRSVETEFPTIVFYDAFTSEVTPSCEPTVSPLNNNKIDFGIPFDESDDEDYTVIYDKNSFSYKIISVNDLKTDSENDNDKVNMPSFPSPEPTIVEQEVKGTASSSSSLSSYNMAFVSSPSSTNEVNTAYGVSTANTQVNPANTQVSPASTQVSTASTQVSTANLSDDTVKPKNLNKSLDPLYGDYIELNDLNVPLELKRDQVDDLMPTIEEGEKIHIDVPTIKIFRHDKVSKQVSPYDVFQFMDTTDLAGKESDQSACKYQ